MEDNAFVFGNCSRILLHLGRNEIHNAGLKLDSKLIEKYGEEMPCTVKLHLPNGHWFECHYSKNEQSLMVIDQLVKDYKDYLNLVLVLCYKGNGNFFVNIFNDGMMEIEYGPITQVPQACINDQDTFGGMGCKFVSIQISEILINGGIDVPQTFVDKCGNSIPLFITICLRNGEVLKGSFMNNYLYGMLPAVKKRYIRHFDSVMFTYRGGGRFDLCIFDRFKIEKTLVFEIIKIDSESESDSDPDTNDQSFASLNQMDIPDFAEGVQVPEIGFSVTMTLSNTNNSAHGVYIPNNIHPDNRNWIIGEKVILRTDAGFWDVGVVVSNGKARLSSGWNKFVKDNNIKFQDTLLFNLIEDDEEGCIFDVEVE